MFGFVLRRQVWESEERTKAVLAEEHGNYFRQLFSQVLVF
jgi:hypothetical protein